MSKLAFVECEARKNRIIVCEDLNFIWDEPELEEIKNMWNGQRCIDGIAEEFNCDPDEILIALIHLARTRKIKRIKGGLF